MSNAALNIFVRVITKRIESGESLNDILESYPKLSDGEKQEIRSAISGGGEI